MDKRLANELLKFFDEEDLKDHRADRDRSRQISKETIDALIEEFGRALMRGADLTATSDKLQGLLEGVTTPEQITQPFLVRQTRSWGTASGNGCRRSTRWRWGNILPSSIRRSLRWCCRADTVTSAALLKTFPRNLSREIVAAHVGVAARYRSAAQLSQKALLEDLLVGRRDADMSPHTRMAQIFNKMDRKAMEESLKAIASYNEKDAEQIRQLLFTFEDLEQALDASPRPGDGLDPAGYDHPGALRCSRTPCGSESCRLCQAGQDVRSKWSSKAAPAPNTRKAAKAQRAMADIALEMIERGIIEVGGEDEVEDV